MRTSSLVLALLTLTASASAQRELFSLDGTAVADEFGTGIRTAGDVDADGVPDFMVASRDGLGRVLVYSGATRQILHDLQGTLGFFGRSMDALGDVDGDGMGDFAISETPGGSSPPTYVYVYSGATGAVLHTFSSTVADVDRMGATIEGIGDVSGDGRGDLLVYATDGCCPTEGLVICYSGASGNEVFRLLATDTGDRLFGFTLAGLSDLDGDGTDDFAVGDNDYFAFNPTTRGRAIVYSGATRSILFTIEGNEVTYGFAQALADAGDVDGDGIGDLLIGNGATSGASHVQVISGANGAELHRFDNVHQGDDFGIVVSGAGDVDGDGRDDVLVGAPGDIPFLVNAGTAYVYSGATGAELFHVSGDTISESVGEGVASAGDLDGDGKAEVLIGHPYFVTTAQTPGRVTCRQLGQDPERIDFELDEDAATPLENGRSVDSNARFGTFFRVSSLGAGHFGAAIFDSSPTGPNAGGPDADLLVDRGNLLILQGDEASSSPGVFDVPDDAAGGGTLRIDLRSPATLVSVDLVDICPGVAHARVRLIDELGRSRFYDVPAGYTADGATRPREAVRRLQLDTLDPQLGFAATATASEDVGFEPDRVLAVEVDLDSSGAIDALRYVPSGEPRYDEVREVYELTAPSSGVGFGGDSRSLGDIDGDGVRELLVSQQNSSTGIGIARLYSGATGAVLREFPGRQSGSLFGDKVAGVGDVDADGVEDIGIGGWEYDLPGEVRNGVVRVYSGRTFGLLHEFFGESGARMGVAVDRLGDVDSDGHDDFLVGANAAAFGSGRIEVRSGATGGILYSIDGAAGDFLGSWLRGIGDADGDGVGDFLSSTGGNLRFDVHSGVDGSLLHRIPGTGYGSLPAGDVDGDGRADVLLKDWVSTTVYVRVLSGRDWSVLHEVSGIPTSVSQYWPAPAGDQDGDGHDDFFVQAPYDPPGLDPFATRIQLFSGRTGLVMFEQEIDNVGSPFERVGDVDGDGFDEFLLRALGDVGVMSVLRRTGYAVCDGDDNSTGRAARLSPIGEIDATANELNFSALDLPVGSTTLLLGSRTFGRVSMPVIGGAASAGDLCIAGGPILRLGVGSADPDGRVSFVVDPAALVPMGDPVSELAGRTLWFQCYYRDLASDVTSRFSDAVAGRF